jgi:iron complex transport system permease protein
VPPVDFWLLGSLTGSTWRAAGNATLLAGFGTLLIVGSARSLDLMALGESQARHVGVDVALVTRVVLLGTALTVGAAGGTAGVLGFVGLLVPHVLRTWMGPTHRPLIVAALFGGAVMVGVADLAARTLASPVEIPVGLVTTVVGGPFFLWLLARGKREVTG